jgi:hypothetical protein
VSLKVVTQLPRGNEDCIQQLVDLQVPSFGLVEDLTNVVHWTLDGSDSPGGGGGPVHLFPFERAQGTLAPLCPVSLLKSRAP